MQASCCTRCNLDHSEKKNGQGKCQHWSLLPKPDQHGPTTTLLTPVRHNHWNATNWGKATKNGRVADASASFVMRCMIDFDDKKKNDGASAVAIPGDGVAMCDERLPVHSVTVLHHVMHHHKSTQLGAGVT